MDRLRSRLRPSILRLRPSVLCLAGDFTTLVIAYLRLGPLRFISMPGEFSPELVIGVPRDFDTPEGVTKYFKRPDLHPTGPDFVLPGTVFGILNCTAASPCFALGLTGDEGGYARARAMVGGSVGGWVGSGRVTGILRLRQGHESAFICPRRVLTLCVLTCAFEHALTCARVCVPWLCDRGA